MDPLDDVFDSLRVRRAMVGRSMVTPPWGLAVASGDPVVLIGMLSGSGWVRREDHEPIPLPQGSIAIIVGGDPVEIADDPMTPPDVVIAGIDICFDPVSGESRLDQNRNAERMWGDPVAPASVVIAGYRASGQRFATLASDLPRVMVVPGDPLVEGALAAAGEEAASDEPGQQVVFDRLMELLLCSALRAWLPTTTHPPSWYRALGDPVVGPALRAIHDDPAHRWTVSELAAGAAESRSGFAKRFREVVGEPPMSYVTRWRLAWAADLLADGASVGGAAATVGYTDPYAFSTAFRRQHGLTPSRHRQTSRSSPVRTHPQPTRS